ncbi:MAG: hypothetical protein CMH58_03090 [Myxococcales bacterium]|nr:hypothetical protein [Myxococcales bacterium]
MVAGVVMISLFTGSLASTLTRNQMTVGVSEYNDLANVSIGVVEGENPMSLVRNKGLSAAGYSSLSDALFALSERKVTTVVHDEPVIRHWLRKHPQQAGSIGLADFYLRKEDYGIAVSKPKLSSERNELLDRINLALVRLKSSGRYDEILHRYLGNQRN